MLIKFIKEIYYRVTSKTPSFFKKLRLICLSIAGICTTLSELGIDTEIGGVGIAKISAFASAIATIITYLPVENSEELNSKIDNNV